MSSAAVEPSTSLRYINGIGPARAEQLSDAGLETVENLLYYFPRRHLDRTTVTLIKNLEKGTRVTVVGKIEACGERRTRKGKLFQAVIADRSGLLNLIWFNGVNYVRSSLKTGDQVAVHGKVEFYKGFQIVHPEYDKLDTSDDPLSTGAIVPIYPLTAEFKKVGLDNRRFRSMIREVHRQITTLPDFFSPKLCRKYKLVDIHSALTWIHFAENNEQLQAAILRLKFEEHFFLQLLMALRRETIKRSKAQALVKIGSGFKTIYEGLPFKLTSGQEKVLKEIRKDMSRSQVMNRLLQGDVGSGKTIIAILASAIAVDNKAQVVVMAPTEILAHQHFGVFRKHADGARLTCALLVGNTKVSERKKLLSALETGKIDIIVGTHALIQKDVVFNNLGLAVVDEQHRFGVVQRGDLLAKGTNPHFLAMTATPIPRTLAITFHGDMDLSILAEIPGDRPPVVTRAVEEDRLPSVYSFMNKEISAGRQCMVVYPLVEESEKSDLAAAVEAYDKLAGKIFPKAVVGLIHGRMKKEEKDRVMNAFGKNEIQVLVSTTVIEVGIDIPNATVMLIEHADRFGLTQLHQLRGRVGRGANKSYCILVQRKWTENSVKRLKIMEQTSDGFVISDEDLKLRGPGEFFGIRQSGFLSYKIADLVTDGPIIRDARTAAFDMIKEDAHLRKPEHGNIRDRFIRDYRHLFDFVKMN